MRVLLKFHGLYSFKTCCISDLHTGQDFSLLAQLLHANMWPHSTNAHSILFSSSMHILQTSVSVKHKFVIIDVTDTKFETKQKCTCFQYKQDKYNYVSMTEKYRF